MGLAALRLELGPIGVGELERGAVIDRRAPAGELAFALELELLLRLVGRIKPAARLELLHRFIIKREALRLLHLEVPGEPEPGEILANALRELFGRALAIGVVETKDKAALALLREHPIQKRRADIARVNASRRTWREANGDGHSTASRGIYW